MRRQDGRHGRLPFKFSWAKLKNKYLVTEYFQQEKQKQKHTRTHTQKCFPGAKCSIKNSSTLPHSIDFMRMYAQDNL